MGDFLKLVGGVPADANANASSVGAADAGKLVKTATDGRLDMSFMPAGVGIEVRSMVASEALSAGDQVNVWNSSGPKVRKADAAAPGKEADGFVLQAAASGAQVTVYTEEGTVSGLAGLTPGTRYFLSAATPGGITDTAPSAPGQVVQVIGKALSATELLFRPRAAITLA